MVVKAFEVTDQDENLDKATKSKMVDFHSLEEKDLWIVLNETLTCNIFGPLHGSHGLELKVKQIIDFCGSRTEIVCKLVNLP